MYPEAYLKSLDPEFAYLKSLELEFGYPGANLKSPDPKFEIS